MPAYWVARSKVNDPVEYKKYTDLVPGIIAKYGGKVLARGGRFQIMEGPDKFHRFIVIEFPTFEQGVACFKSPEYDKAAAFRRSGAGEVETMTGRTADGRIETVRVVPDGSPVANYGFDVTPARLITGLITERGVIAASREALARAFPERAGAAE